MSESRLKRLKSPRGKARIRRQLQVTIQQLALEPSDSDIAFEVACTFKIRDDHGDWMEFISVLHDFFKKTG